MREARYWSSPAKPVVGIEGDGPACWPVAQRATTAELRLASQRLRDRFLGQRRHDLVSRVVGMQPIVGELALQHAFVIDHGGGVVQIHKTIPGTVSLEPAVHSQ